jgi:hypothetical protein
MREPATLRPILSRRVCSECTEEDDRCEGHAIESLRRNPCATESAKPATILPAPRRFAPSSAACPDDREARNRTQSDSIATVALCCHKSPDCRAARAPGCITCPAQWAKPRIVMQPAIMVFICRTSHPPMMSRMSEVRGVPDPFRNDAS